MKHVGTGGYPLNQASLRPPTHDLISSEDLVAELTIHDHITGVYGSRAAATEFLLSHTVGSDIACYVNPSAPFYAASVRPQIVYSGVVFICCLLGTLSLVSVVMVLVTLKSFSHFLSSYLWDEEKGVWVEVKGSL